MKKSLKTSFANVPTEGRAYIYNRIQRMLVDGVGVHIVNAPVIYYGQHKMRVAGFFDSDPKLTFKVAIGKDWDKWFGVFVHEYCHYTQWKDGIKEWDALSCDEVEKWDDWIEGKDCLTTKQARKATTLLRTLELDCERRTLDEIKKYDLPIDPDFYTKQVNAYMYFYEVAYKERSWSKRSPYNDIEVLKHMPSTLVRDYTRVPKRAYTALKACLKRS